MPVVWGSLTPSLFYLTKTQITCKYCYLTIVGKQNHLQQNSQFIATHKVTEKNELVILKIMSLPLLFRFQSQRFKSLFTLTLADVWQQSTGAETAAEGSDFSWGNACWTTLLKKREQFIDGLSAMAMFQKQARLNHWLLIKHRFLASCCNHLPNAPLPNTVALGVRFQHMNFWQMRYKYSVYSIYLDILH